jgi:2-oxoglutarate dehydrogenase E2 component (dihydrolipoamide succinyltransferase)
VPESVEPVVETVKMQKPELIKVHAKQDSRPDGAGFISPVVARMASEHAIDLSKVPGTGRGGRITKKDVRAYIETSQGSSDSEAPWESPASGELFRPSEEVFGSQPKEIPGPKSEAKPGTVLPMNIVRKSIAEHMVRSRKTSPHVTTLMEVDLSQVVAHRKKNKEIFSRDGVKLTYLAYFVAGAIAGLKAWPIGNSTWQDDGILLHKQVNIGIAVSLGEGGLIVPVIKDADQASLLGLARSIEELAGKARAHKLNPDDVQGGTFTITNHGGSGSLLATPIINQPQAAILGVGKVQKRVVAMETLTGSGEKVDTFAIRPMVYLTLTFDHRILDGAIADYLLGEIVSKLENWN